MKEQLLKLLRGLEEAIHPSENGHHAITRAMYGSDTDGWEEKLALQINQGGVFHCFFINDMDLENPETTIKEIASELHAPVPVRYK